MTDLSRLELVDCPNQWSGENVSNTLFAIQGSYIYFGPSSLRVPLPPGNYELLGRGDLISEEQWEKLIEKYDEHCVHCCWPDFTREEIFANRYVLNTAKESGLSWIRLHGKEPSKTILLLIK